MRAVNTKKTVSDAESTFSERWRGKFVLTDRDDKRYEYLVKRYS